MPPAPLPEWRLHARPSPPHPHPYRLALLLLATNTVEAIAGEYWGKVDEGDALTLSCPPSTVITAIISPVYGYEGSCNSTHSYR